MNKVVRSVAGLVAMIAVGVTATLTVANANDFSPTPIQPPALNSVPNIPAPMPAPTPDPNGWVRPIPIPNNPGVVGGATSGGTSMQFRIQRHNQEVTIQHRMEIPGS